MSTAHNKNALAHNQGITIIELLMIIALIGILTTYSTGFYSRFLKQNAVFNTADQLMASFQRAQILSMMGKYNASWGVNLSGTTLTLYAGNSFAARNTSYDEVFEINPNISITGMSEVNFRRVQGTPSATPAISISGSGSTKTVSVNAQGVSSR